jgi:hypothetical protein
MLWPSVIRIEFPALDNLVTFLIGNQQTKVDAAAAEIDVLTERLRVSRMKLADRVRAVDFNS